MAIAYKSSTYGYSGFSYTPLGAIAAGDLLVLVGNPSSTPTGYTLATSIAGAKAYYKIATGSETGTFSFAGALLLYSGVSGFDVAGINGTSYDISYQTSPSVTTTASGDLVVFINYISGGTDQGPQTVSSVSQGTVRINAISSSLGVTVADTILATTGATGTTQWNLASPYSSSVDFPASSYSFTLAFKAATFAPSVSLSYLAIGAIQPRIGTGLSLSGLSIGAVQPYIASGSLAVNLGTATISSTALTAIPNPSSSTLAVSLGGGSITAAAATTIPTPASSTLAVSLGGGSITAAAATIGPVPSAGSAGISLGSATVASSVLFTPARSAFASSAVTLPGVSLSATVSTAAFVATPNTTYTGDDLIEAIWTYLDPLRADDFGKSGWLWRDEAARNQRLPYAVIFSVAASETEIHSGDGYTYQIPVQINVFGSKADASRLGDLIHDDLLPRKSGHPVFAWKQWYELSRWVNTGNMLEKDPDRGPDGSDVWTYRLHLTFLVARSYSR